MKNCVIVPIKTVNKRLPNKTFRKLNDKPLYTYLFTTLSNLKGNTIDEVFIDSSDENVLKIAQEWGFKTFKRPEEYNSDSTAGNQLITRIINDLKEYDIIGLLHITTPFLSEETIKKAIFIIREDKEIDSLFGVTPIYNRLWYKNKPVNHDINNLIRTQDLTPVHEEADFYFFRNKSFKKYGKRVCGNYQTMEVSKIEAVDIDDLKDLLYSEILIKNGLVKQ